LFETEAIDLLRRFYALGNKNAPLNKARKISRPMVRVKPVMSEMSEVQVKNISIDYS
jgi:hypothetical protein